MSTITQQKSLISETDEPDTALKKKPPGRAGDAAFKGFSNANRRAEIGSKGTGGYYHIIIRPKDLFTTFRNQDVGRRGGLQRLAGKRLNGEWSTHAWLVHKSHAHVVGDRLIADSDAAKELFDNLIIPPVQWEGDIFMAKAKRDGRSSK